MDRKIGDRTICGIPCPLFFCDSIFLSKILLSFFHVNRNATKSEDSKSAALPPTAITHELNSASILVHPKAPSIASQTAYRPAAKAESIRSWQILAPWIAAVSVFGVAAMLLRLIISVMKANRLRRESQLVTESRLHEILRTIATRYSVKLMPALM